LIEVWEDGPFFARCLIERRLGSVAVPAEPETLSLDRFTSPIAQMMPPFRMPRRAWPHRHAEGAAPRASAKPKPAVSW
jgi:carotenoid 1,2-hydratase